MVNHPKFFGWESFGMVRFDLWIPSSWSNEDIAFSVGIGARSFNIDRSSHGTADIDTYYQHFNIETTYKKQTKTK